MRHDIPKGAIRHIQTQLRSQGLYSGTIDGIRTVRGGGLSQTDRGIDTALSARQTELTLRASENDISGWSNKRKAVGYFQLLMKDDGQDIGPADGFWGPQTDTAYNLFTGITAPDWRDRQDQRPSNGPRVLNPNGWPVENTRSLTRFYGAPCQIPLVRVNVPWTMKLAWDKSTRIRTVSVHEKNAPSLGRVFNDIASTYNAREITDYGLDLFGGSYNCRRKRGGTTMSTHSWAIALDFDPQRNQLRWGANRAFLARPELDPFWTAWEKEGWRSLGREKNFDWMHVQAAIPS